MVDGGTAKILTPITRTRVCSYVYLLFKPYVKQLLVCTLAMKHNFRSADEIICFVLNLVLISKMYWVMIKIVVLQAQK